MILIELHSVNEYDIDKMKEILYNTSLVSEVFIIGSDVTLVIVFPEYGKELSYDFTVVDIEERIFDIDVQICPILKRKSEFGDITKDLYYIIESFISQVEHSNHNVILEMYVHSKRFELIDEYSHIEQWVN